MNVLWPEPLCETWEWSPLTPLSTLISAARLTSSGCPSINRITVKRGTVRVFLAHGLMYSTSNQRIYTLPPRYYPIQPDD